MPQTRRSTLGIGAQLGRQAPITIPDPEPAPLVTPQKSREGRVVISGYFPPEVRRAFLLLRAHPANTGKNIERLLGEAINDLCEKYQQVPPYRP